MNMLFLILFRYLDFSIISFVLCRAYILKKKNTFLSMYVDIFTWYLFSQYFSTNAIRTKYICIECIYLYIYL